MINKYGVYEDFVKSILKRICLVKTEQLLICLQRKYGEEMNYQLANKILQTMQNSGYILLTDDGWAMQKGVYVELTNDKFYDNINYLADNFINFNMDDVCKKYNKEVINCMWIAAAMMPEADDFIVSNAPWFITFLTKQVDEKPAHLYQVTYIPKEYADLNAEVLKTTVDIKNKEGFENLGRIALLDDDTYVNKVPKVGFSHIAVLDDNELLHYKIIEKRNKEERWA